MKIVVYPHDLNMGGSQLNAIELGAAVRDLGHEVVVFGRPGTLVPYIEELGLEFIEAPEPGKRPSPRVARALRDLVRGRGIDVLHGYEWPPALESVFATRIGARRAVPVATVMSMAIASFIPRRMLLAVGTEQIADHERRIGRQRVGVIEPPVDVHANSMDAVDPDGFIREHALDPDALTVVVVCRLVQELKLEGLLSAIDAMGHLDEQDVRAQLVIVGDGDARDTVATRAAGVNERVGRPAVVLTGQLADPRPAYAAADVMLGMGGSALRSLAFAKPLVVQGENGFWKLLTENTVDEFLWQGWYGHGDDPALGARTLVEQLQPLRDASERERLGAYGRDLIVGRFSLEQTATAQVEIYRRALEARPGALVTLFSDAVALVRYAAYYVRKRWNRLRDRAATDDFNAKPVVATARGKDHR